MKIIFCADPLQTNSPDSAYAEEVIAATENGFSYDLFDFNALTSGNPEKALRKIRPATGTLVALYRGWMLTPEQYGLLYDTLYERGLKLINSPDEYSHCHWFPNSYSLIESQTPRSVCIPPQEINDWEKIHQRLRSLALSRLS